MKAVIYARVSSKDQEETGYSLPAQEKFLKEYAEKRQFKVTRVFAISESASGKKQREVFGEMMDYVTKQGIKIVICEKVDRLTRNFKDAVSIDEWLEEDEERQMHLVKDSLILHKNSRSQEKLNWGIRILFAKNYIDNLSEEVKKGLAEKLRQGWLPTKPPVGYKTIGEKGRKTHIIDEVKAPLVKKMFELYATGNYGTDVLAEVMEKAGLRNAGGHRIYKSRIASLLTDPFYIGKIKYNGAIHAGAHEPLLEEELFIKAGQLLRRNGAPRYRKHTPLFKALIKCSECGGSVTWEIQKGHWYGHCNKYNNCTQRKYVRQEKVEAQLMPYLESIRIWNDRLVEWIKKALKESHNDEVAFNSSARDELNKRYEAIQRRLETLYDDKLDGKITEDFYQKKFQQYSQEKEEIVSSLKKHDTANTKYYELGANVIDLARRAKEIYSSERRKQEEKRILLNLLFSSLRLNGEELAISYSKAFGMLNTYAVLWNKKFEPTQKATESGLLCGVAVTTPDISLMELSEPRNNIRTSEKSPVKARFGDFYPKSRPLLSIVDKIRTYYQTHKEYVFLPKLSLESMEVV